LVDALSESSTTPVLVGDVLVGSSVTYGSVGLKLEIREGRPAFTELWKNPALTCYFSTPIGVGKDYLYLVSGTLKKPPSATLRCVEARTGRELWNRPDIGRYHGALLRTADEKLLLLDDRGGLALLEPSPEGYRELARTKVCGPSWAHPALAGGRLYVRDDQALLCLEVGK
jgi:hypothetical protein